MNARSEEFEMDDMNLHTSEQKAHRYTMIQVAADRFGKPFSQLNQKNRQEAERIALRKFELERKILSSEDARHVVITAERVKRAVDNIVARYPNRSDYEAELEASGLDQISFTEAVRRELRVEAIMDLVTSRVPVVTDTDARLYYYFNRDKFRRPETRIARHVLITVNPDFPENTREQALVRISMVARRLQKKPARFAEQAKKHSECPTAMEGGVLGRIKKGMLFPALEKALFDLPVEGVSEVITSPLGFHVLMCEEIIPAGVAPVDEVIPVLIEKLTKRKQKSFQQQWVRSLMRTESRIVVSDKDVITDEAKD